MDLSDRINQVPNLQYYIVMVDYGRPFFDKKGPFGLEAIVDPEDSRREIVEQVSNILASNHLSLVHVKFVDGSNISDVTHEIIAEALEAELAA